MTRICVSTVLGFYRERLRKEGVTGGQSGAVVVVQRTSSDLKLHPHLHALFLDGAYAERESGVSFTELPRLSTHEVGEVLARVVARIVKHLCRRGLLEALEGAGDADGDDESDGLTALAASARRAASGPTRPEWRRKAAPLSPLPAAAPRYDKPLCASQDGFTLHDATRAGAVDTVGREALCSYVLRPPIAQERVTRGPDGLVRITLKRPFADGTVAVDMDPLSLLSRLATAVPPPRLHTVRYAGVLAPASKMRPKVVPRPPVAAEGTTEAEKLAKPAGSLALGRAPQALLCDRRPRMSTLRRTHATRRARHRGGVGAPLPPRPRRVDRRSCSGPSAGPSVLEEPCAATCSGRGVGRLAERHRARGADGVTGDVCRGAERAREERRRFKPSFPIVPLARRTPCRPSESPLEASNPPLHPVLARSLDPGHTRPHDRSPHGSAATPPTPRRRLFAARSSSSTEVPGQAPERKPRSPRRGLGGSGARTPPR